MKSPKNRIEMFLRTPIRYIHAWMALKTLQFTEILEQAARSDSPSMENRFEKTKMASDVMTEIHYDIAVTGDIEWAEHRTSVYPDGRQYIEIWTYPPTTGEREDE